MKSTGRLIILSMLGFFSLSPLLHAEKSYPFEVKKSGTGKMCIFFIPGFACSGEVWDGVKTSFERDFTCYTLTMSGFAGVKPTPGADFENWESAIASYISDNHIDKPILVGHSMGGVLAMALAADYPDLISRIIVVDALPCLAALRNPSFAAVGHPDCSALNATILTQTDSQFYQMQKNTIAYMLEDSSKRGLVIDWAMKSDRATFAQMYCSFSNTDLRKKIAMIRSPSLILLEPFFKNQQTAIEAQFINLKPATIRFAGKGLHFIMYDDKDWLEKQLDEFIHSPEKL